jgi:hypothetical protein
MSNGKGQMKGQCLILRLRVKRQANKTISVNKHNGCCQMENVDKWLSLFFTRGLSQLELEKYNTVIAADQETEWKVERTTAAGYFIMFHSRSMVSYISDTRLISMANQNIAYQDNHKVLQYQCMAGEGACWTHGRWMSETQVWPTCIKSGSPHQIR